MSQLTTRDQIKTGEPLPLAHLRRGPGRPRKHSIGDSSSDGRLDRGQRSPVMLQSYGHGAEALIAQGQPSRLLDRAEAADYLGISTDTLDRLVRQGHVHRHRLLGTRCVRFDVRELDRFVDSSS